MAETGGKRLSVYIRGVEQQFDIDAGNVTHVTHQKHRIVCCKLSTTTLFYMVYILL